VSTPNPNPVLTQEELNAAIAEVEPLAPGEGGIPNLDDATETTAVPIPIPIQPPPVVRAVAARQPAHGASAAPTQAEVSRAEAPATTLERPGLIARLLSSLRHTHPSDVENSAASGVPAPRANVLYRLVDGLLGLVNRPFAALSPPVRQAIGAVGIVTIIVSLAAGGLFPRLFPPKDAVAFLRAKRAQAASALASPAKEAEPKPSKAEGHH
jgi:hypothetical protein